MKTSLHLLFISLLLFAQRTEAQLADNFADGNFLENPLWETNATDWITNSALRLQSNNTITNSSFYISTVNTLATNAQWEFYVNLNFNTSSANYVDVFLTASASDLTAATTNGYFVRIGNTADEISLYCKKGANIIKLIDGIDGSTNSSNNTLKIKVTRDANDQWTLLRDLKGTGTNFFTEGKAIDATYTISAYFGILVKQSTASFFQRHFFDDIAVKPYTPDITAPVIQSATVISFNEVELLFDESLDNASSQLVSNYTADNLLGEPVTAVLDAVNPSLVRLSFTNRFVSGFNYQLVVNGVKDLEGNTLVNGSTSFVYVAPYIASQYDIVINEIMADPTPQIGLPNNEWIELKNTSVHSINLKDWRIGDLTGQSGPMPDYVLQPDSFLMVCSSSAASTLSAFGKTIIVTSFPSLDNFADQVFLQSAQNNIIHSVNYKESWYQNELKKNGGWTLEMIDTKNPCSGFSNWKASIDLRGGSPGKRNSIDGLNPDKEAPRITRAYAIDSLNIVLVFDEPLDIVKASSTGNYTISDGVGIPVVAIANTPAFDRVHLKLNAPLVRKKIYTITVAGIADCVGNLIGNKNTARVGLSEIAATLDIVINEILFNPPPNGTDYVELYNRSNSIIDLKQTYIANRNSSGVISSIVPCSAESQLLFPQDFLVITESAAMVKANFIAQNLDVIIEISTMPSYNNDKGTVVILNAQGAITDELNYNEKWHFKLIDNPKGVALERIDYNATTQSPDNWHSAATSSGYGTPTYKNSQYRINDGLQGELKVSPEIVSPDNDGQDDFATINYKFPEAGYVANITLFDAAGRPVRYLQRNALCGTTGSFRWDGLGERNQQLATGVYVVFSEVFNLKGNKKVFKQAIVLARRN